MPIMPRVSYLRGVLTLIGFAFAVEIGNCGSACWQQHWIICGIGLLRRDVPRPHLGCHRGNQWWRALRQSAPGHHHGRTGLMGTS